MAVWNHAVWQTRRDRRKDGEPLRRIWNVTIACRAKPDVLLRAYLREMKKLGDPPHFKTRWTLWRQIKRHVELKRIARRRGKVFHDDKGYVVGREPSTIVFTREGMKYVRRRASDVQFPREI